MSRLNDSRASLARRFILSFAAAVWVFGCAAGPARATITWQEESDEARQDGETLGAPRGGGLRVRLRLTPEQVEQVRAVRQQTEREMRPLRQRVRAARRELDEAIYSGANETEVESRARALSAAQGELIRLRALAELRLRRLLTPSQLDTLRSMRRAAPRTGEDVPAASAAEPRTDADPTTRKYPRPLRRGPRRPLP